MTTPSGRARAWARMSAQGWEVVYLPFLRPIEGLERTGNWSLGVILLLALAAPPLLLLALPRAAFRDLKKWPDATPVAPTEPKVTIEYWEVGATGRTTRIDNHKDFWNVEDDWCAGAVVVDVVHPALRSTAASVLSLTQNLFGLAAGPLLTGVMSDRYGLPFALSVVPLFCVLAAIVFLIAARTYESDLRNVAANEPAYDDGLRPQAA